jgi:hypothetical protein
MDEFSIDKKDMRKFNFKKNVIGWIAVVLILIAYALITFELVKSQSLLYNCLNLVGGSLLAWRVLQDKNYSNFFLEVVFVLIAIIGILKAV